MQSKNILKVIIFEMAIGTGYLLKNTYFKYVTLKFNSKHVQRNFFSDI